MKKRFKRCGAKAKSNNHQPCKKPAMKNGRCRLHGGMSTGAKTEEGKARAARSNYKHGYYTKEAILERKLMREKMKEWRDDLDNVHKMTQVNME